MSSSLSNTLNIGLTVKILEEPMVVLWNPAGDKYAIMFDKTINIYNVTVSKKKNFLHIQ